MSEATPRPWWWNARFHDVFAAANACHELGVEPDKLVERVRQTVEALKELDTYLDFGIPFRPDDTGPRNPDKLNLAFVKAEAALALWAIPETPPEGEKGGHS